MNVFEDLVLDATESSLSLIAVRTKAAFDHASRSKDALQKAQACLQCRWLWQRALGIL